MNDKYQKMFGEIKITEEQYTIISLTMVPYKDDYDKTDLCFIEIWNGIGFGIRFVDEKTLEFPEYYFKVTGDIKTDLETLCNYNLKVNGIKRQFGLIEYKKLIKILSSDKLCESKNISEEEYNNIKSKLIPYTKDYDKSSYIFCHIWKSSDSENFYLNDLRAIDLNESDPEFGRFGSKTIAEYFEKFSGYNFDVCGIERVFGLLKIN